MQKKQHKKAPLKKVREIIIQGKERATNSQRKTNNEIASQA